MEPTTQLELHLDRQTVAGIVVISGLSATVMFFSLGLIKVGLDRANKRIAARVAAEKAQKEAGND